MKMPHCLNFLPAASWCLGMLLIAGCGSQTVTSELPVAGRIYPPDRMLIHRFQVIPQGTEYGVAPVKQSADEVRVGRALADAIANNLVSELSARGVKAALAKEDAPPEENTIWIFGRFMHAESPQSSNVVGGYVFGDPLRARVMVFQGSGSSLQFIAQADTATATSLRAGMAPAAEKAAVEADAKIVAKAGADRITDFYRKHGLLK
ncbi:MAG TPA: hypothetical protein VL754_18115 [Verrucomicrobiae bacterium]|jgi:hypothetical protein|nr:hypothetical protein [Verrucomicrobiae bacterium]